MKYKKYIMKKFEGYLYEDVMMEIDNLTALERTSLLKEYVRADIKVKKEPLTNKEKNKNKNTINKLNKKVVALENGTNYVPRETREYKSFFSLFKGSKKEDILTAVSLLSMTYRMLLFKKYGENLNGVKRNLDITEDERRLISQNITKYIKRNLIKIESGEYIIVNVEDLFPKGMTFEEITEIAKKLPKNQRRKLYSYFEENLLRKTLIAKSRLEKFLNSNLVKCINKTITNTRFIHKNFKPFIELFDSVRQKGETDESLLLRIKREFINLTNEELQILYLKFDKDLKNTTINENLTSKINFTIIHDIIPKLKYYMNKRLNPVQCKPLKDLIPFASYEEILEEINKLSETDQILFRMKYHDDLLGTTYLYGLSKDINIRISNNIKKIRLRILRKKEKETLISIDILKRIRKIMLTKEFKTLEEILGADLSLAVLTIKYFSDVCTIEQISKLTDINKMVAIIVSKNYLYAEKSNIQLSDLDRKTLAYRIK